jgi:anti-sigma factor RsiW
MTMELSCKEAVPMIGAYVDGELSESRAALLRKHLLECNLCRNATQDGKSIKRWFAPARAELQLSAAGDFSIPSGFASRVARRAFAGDTGDRGGSEEFVLRPVARPFEGRTIKYLVAVTAIAAGIAIVLALAVRLSLRPASGKLSADDRTVMPMATILSELEQLNALEGPARVLVPDPDAAGQ